MENSIVAQPSDGLPNLSLAACPNGSCKKWGQPVWAAAALRRGVGDLANERALRRLKGAGRLESLTPTSSMNFSDR